MAHVYEPVAKLNEMIAGIEFAILTTMRPDESLHSCPMEAQPADANAVLWFLTCANTEKVEAVRTIQRVNLAYADHASQRYVSVSGFCELVRDHAKAAEMWDNQYESWCAGGLGDPNLILLKVNVQQVEYWDGSAGTMVELPGFNKAAVS